ncbi:hypothetical protein [Xanthobacter aminoxidans]|uniref:hypothetical protein n=1 Tax=Xanthobacter aminoxidans TaxID=186280 RepID=UPI00372A606C
MTHEEMEAFGQDLALAVRVSGQKLADLARATDPSGSSSALITKIFDHAAKAVELRVELRIIESLSVSMKGDVPHG